MKISVVGSRSFDGELAYGQLSMVLGVCAIDEIISGGAAGTDRLAERYAIEHEIGVLVCPAEWDKFPGHQAAYERNKMMVELSDAVVAFWDGELKGTRMTMQLCWKLGKPLSVIRTDMLEAGGDDGDV